MTTPVSSFTRSRVLLTVQEETNPSQESLEVTAPLTPSSSSEQVSSVTGTQTGGAQDEQASLKAEFDQIQRNYYATIQRTNKYSDVSQAQDELYAAYQNLSDFAEKHPKLKCIVPRSPFASNHDCSIS